MEKQVVIFLDSRDCLFSPLATEHSSFLAVFAGELWHTSAQLPCHRAKQFQFIVNGIMTACKSLLVNHRDTNIC